MKQIEWFSNNKETITRQIKGTIFSIEMKTKERAVFTPTLVNELKAYGQWLKESSNETNKHVVVIEGDRETNTYSFGGDLRVFLTALKAKNIEGIADYLHVIRDILLHAQSLRDYGILSSTIINGTCVAGGFTNALAMDIIIAEKEAKIGFPSAKHGIFGGMGSYDFLSRKVGDVIASEILMSGRLYSAQEMHALGVVDIVCDRGKGIDVLCHHIETVGLDRLLKETQREMIEDASLYAAANHCLMKLSNLQDKEIRLIEMMYKKQERMAG